jgi:phosphoenolpyruvate carboxykinase (GTP)
MARRVSFEKLPKIFQVNWFRTDENGKFLWPGFGENIRVLKWIIERVRDTGTNGSGAVESPLGYLPATEALDLAGLELPEGALEKLLYVDRAEWTAEAERHKTFFEQFGQRLPPALWNEYNALRTRLGSSAS